MKKIIPIATLAAGAYLLFRYLSGKKAALQNLKVVPVSVSIDTAKSSSVFFTRLFYKVKLNLNNVESQPVFVRNIDLDVFFEGRNIAKIVRDSDFIVPARGVQTIELEASLDSVNAISKIIDIIKSGPGRAKVTITGIIGTDLGDIPVNFEKSFSGAA